MVDLKGSPDDNGKAEPADTARRAFVKLTGLGAASLSLGSMFAPFAASAALAEKGASAYSPPVGGNGFSAVGWDDYPSVLARIKAPTFPARDFPITQYGAVANGTSDASEAIRQAVEACHAGGGGRVVVPAGVFFCGPIVLKSHVNLHLEQGATLRFSTDPAKYPLVLTRFEGTECMNYSPFIYAFEQENIAVTGKGTLDGQASDNNWWAWKKQKDDPKRLIEMGDQNVPVSQRIFGPGHLLRPSFIQFYRCRDILIEDVKIRNSPMFEIHPVLSANITVRGVDIFSHGPNNDGCDPDSCSDVLIENCVFDTGDDCIAIKSGKNNDGRRVNVPSENIVVRNCTMKDGHGGVVLGSECSGHIRNVFAENCEMDSPSLERMLRFKNNAVRGGVLENVFVRNIRVGRVAEAILTIDFLYEEGAKGAFKPVVRNVQIDNVVSRSSPRVMYVVTIPGAVIDRIRFSNCIFKGVEATEVLAISGTVEFSNVVIEPRSKSSSLNSRPSV